MPTITKTMNKLFLLDAYALIFRAHYAFVNRPMRNSAGLNTSAVFGFTRFLRDIIVREKPRYLGVAFDPKGGNFRHKLYPEYKANRAETPEDIILAVPYIKRILDAMCIPVLEVAGYEADDVIGTLAREASDADFTTFMVTPDKDYGQLVGPRSFIYKQRKGGEGVEIVDEAAIEAQYGIDDPRLVADILALWGDVSDNVPGVPGIGEKGAMRLVAQWGPVEEILKNASRIGGRVGENLVANSDQLLLSKRLVTIDTSVPIDFVPSRLEMCDPDCPTLVDIYKELGFATFLREMAHDDRSPFNSAVLCQGQPVAEQGLSIQPAAGGGDGLTSSTNSKQFSTLNSQFSPPLPSPDLFSSLPVVSAAAVESADELEELMKGCVELAFLPATDGSVVFSTDGETNRSADVAMLRRWLEDPAVAKIGYDLKSAMHILRRKDISLKGQLFDVMLLAYLLDPEGRRTVPQSAAEAFASKAGLWEGIESQNLEKLYRTIEEPLIGVLESMESEGVRVDIAILHEYGRELNGRLVSLQNDIRTLTAEPALNVNSSQQLGEALFGKMRLVDKPKKTRTRQYSTDEETLAAIADRHPVVPKILEYRGVKKLLSTYVEALPRLVDPRTGKIHTTYNQAVTATGRLSSTNPNLQNIPIRQEQGRMIRRAFVASDDDHVLLSADYSQVELRIMAHLSGDGAMIGAFERGEDIHRDTAARVFGVPIDEVTTEQRRRAKTANFGIIYGISAFGLSQRLGIPRLEAAEIIEGYFRSYPGVKNYMESVARQARERGFVETIFGRRRYLPDINSQNATVRSLAERNAINAPIQGSAADIMKIAMVRIFGDLGDAGLRSRMIMQVHDEVVVDVFKPELPQVTSIVTAAMEGAAQLAVRLIVECGVGNNWLDAH